MNTGNNDSYWKEIERALKKIASMVLLLSLTACTGQNPSADLSGNHEGAAQQEESADGSRRLLMRVGIIPRPSGRNKLFPIFIQ